jgi:molecular chaperone GrpE
MPFDPAIHEAIQHLETNDFAPGCVAAEVQPGYRAAGRLIRPAMVVVAKAPSGAEEVTTNASSSESAGGESPDA